MLFQIFFEKSAKNLKLHGLFQKINKNFFFGLINSPEPPDHLPMLEASEIVVKVFQIYDQMLKICPF